MAVPSNLSSLLCVVWVLLWLWWEHGYGWCYQHLLPVMPSHPVYFPSICCLWRCHQFGFACAHLENTMLLCGCYCVQRSFLQLPVCFSDKMLLICPHYHWHLLTVAFPWCFLSLGCLLLLLHLGRPWWVVHRGMVFHPLMLAAHHKRCLSLRLLRLQLVHSRQWHWALQTPSCRWL